MVLEAVISVVGIVLVYHDSISLQTGCEQTNYEKTQWMDGRNGSVAMRTYVELFLPLTRIPCRLHLTLVPLLFSLLLIRDFLQSGLTARLMHLQWVGFTQEQA
jgi:hypothetical protein